MLSVPLSDTAWKTTGTKVGQEGRSFWGGGHVSGKGIKTGREWGLRSGDATAKGQRRMLRRCSWRKWGRISGAS